MTSPRITVVGGANTDLVGVPEGRFIPGDSNPGHGRVSAGSGRDPAADCEALGIDISASVRLDDLPGPRYLAVLDDRGGLAAAVSDMRALGSLTAAALSPHSF